jgi:hypothetical protein
MIASCTPAILLFAACLSCCQTPFAQKKIILLFDSTLEANSEEWEVDFHMGFKKSPKVEFGPYTTLPIKTVEKQEAYTMLLANTTDTAELSFSVSRFKHRRSSTLPDRLLSSDFSLFGSKGDITVAYGFKIAGIIATASDSIPSRFFMEDSASAFYAPTPTARYSYWHLVSVNDSLYTEPFRLQYGKPGKKSYELREGVYVKNAAGIRIAALSFGNSSTSQTYYTWMRKDIDPRQLRMIASLFSLMMVARSDYFW